MRSYLAVSLACSLVVLLVLTTTGTAFAQSCNTSERSVLLILDASGSMNARLPEGETRIAVAQRAVKGVVSFLPAEAPLSLRIYGDQSPRAQKNCADTHSTVAFGPAGSVTGAIGASVDAVTAQGYTPIAYSLQQAAADFSPDAKDKVIVLVSDGKETCDGDPTLAARALADQGITVHTVGFIVDTAARGQLQAIARATGGSYFDAPVGPELPDTLKSAFEACKKTVVLLPKKPKPGKLHTTSATGTYPVFNAETGSRAGELDHVTTTISLPAGVYEVQFGPARWKGIEIKPEETTTIEPGTLRMEPNAGADLIDSETGEKHGRFDAVTSEVTVMPGVYDLHFSKTDWRFIKVDGGAVTTVKPMQVVLGEGLEWQKAKVLTKEGKEVFRFDAVTSKATLPPGEYVVEVDDNKIPFDAAEGDVLELKPQ